MSKRNANRKRAGAAGSRDRRTAPTGSNAIAPGGKVCPERMRSVASHARSPVNAEDPSAESDSPGAESEDDGALTVHFKLTRDLKKRLDKYLQDRIPFMSRSQLQRLIKEEAVTVNGRTPKPSTTLRLGDEIEVIVPPPPTNEIPPENIPVNVLYEDDDMIVINKQDDIIVHPARGNKTGTIINALAWHFAHRSSGALSEVGKDQVRPGVVHRLDRHTTGALIAAKSDVAHWRLGKQFANRTTDKRYLAIVVGKVEPLVDTIELPIGKHPTIRELMAVRFDDTAKPAVTIYRVREQFRGYALIELELKTGRTHQIRVHLAHLGWPIVGDDMYGGPLLNLGDLVSNAESPQTPLMDRQCLHACSITIRHPLTHERMEFVAPLPADFRRLVELLRLHRKMNGVLSPPGATLNLDVLFA